MRLSDVLKQSADLRDALADLGAQHIDAARVRLDDLEDPTAIRREQARIAAWKEILKHVLQAKDREDKHARRNHDRGNGRTTDWRTAGRA